MAAPAGFIREHQLCRASCRRSTMAWPRLPGSRPRRPASRPCAQLQSGNTGSTGRLPGDGGVPIRGRVMLAMGRSLAMPGCPGWAGSARAGCRGLGRVWRGHVPDVRVGGSLGRAPPRSARSPPSAPSPVPRTGAVGVPWPRAPGRRWQRTQVPPLLPEQDQNGCGQGSHLGYTGVTGPQSGPPRGAGAS